jgi:dedicator of cytokinesis protein 3
MLDLVQHLDPAWRETGTLFVLSVSRLLERLLDYRDVLQGEENRNKRMSCTVNLLKFYRDDINRQEMFIRYIYKLYDLHTEVNNHVEAAFTLQLHANQLAWSTRMLHADLMFPAQQEWQRKEQLYGQIINLLDKSKLWEYALPLCKELADLYEARIYDFAKLSDILRRQATFYQKIMSEFRPEPEYYMVGFYGLSFPLFVRNKQFIYRGLDYEKISDFTGRLLKEFPGAALCTAASPPEQELREQEAQSIQCRLVRPVRQEAGVYMGPEVPDKIRAFYSVNKVSSFLFDRPFHRGSPDPHNEAKTLWIKRLTLACATQFPGILKWFEVVSTGVSEVNPAEFACETVQQKNTDLGRCLREYSGDRSKDLRPFTMILSGTIDAAVNGGINKYREAFFSPDFPAGEAGEAVSVERLAGLITELARLLGEALVLHGELAPEPMKPLHENLLQKFHEMSAGMQRSALLTSPARPRQAPRIVNTPLPPVPGGHKLERKDSGLSVNSNSLYCSRLPTGCPEDAIYCRPSEFGNMANSYQDLGTETYHDIEYRDGPVLPADHRRLSITREPPVPPHDYVWLPPSSSRNGPTSPRGPPLPPRGSSYEAPTPGTPGPPVLPRRPSKKSPRQSRSALTDSGVMCSEASGSPPPPGSRPPSPRSPPPLQRRSTSTRRPPPLPPKLSPHSPPPSSSPTSEPDLPTD